MRAKPRSPLRPALRSRPGSRNDSASRDPNTNDRASVTKAEHLDVVSSASWALCGEIRGPSEVRRTQLAIGVASSPANVKSRRLVKGRITARRLYRRPPTRGSRQAAAAPISCEIVVEGESAAGRYQPLVSAPPHVFEPRARDSWFAQRCASAPKPELVRGPLFIVGNEDPRGGSNE